MDDGRKILLDTDIGSDIDDALCLAYLLSQPRCDLLGITTVTGEPLKRAMLADALCQSAGRTDIPILSGTADPLLVPQRQTQCPQADVLSSVAHRESFEPNAAVEFMRQTIRKYPGEVTLLAIGPLTNIGLLFALDPEIPSLLNQLVLMCGIFDMTSPNAPKCEWNALCDPHAAAIVFNAALPKLVSIGLDVTLRCTIKADEARKQICENPLMNLVGKMAEVWLQKAEHVVFHDPLAAAVIFEPGICDYKSGLCSVETYDRDLQGMMIWNTNTERKPHTIAVGVRPDQFFNHYFSVTKP